MIARMPGLPGYRQSKLSVLFLDAAGDNLREISDPKDRQLDFCNARPWQVPLSLGNKHKACRPTAYRMFNEWETKSRPESLQAEKNGGGGSGRYDLDGEQYDLAAMVLDFIENGTSNREPFRVTDDDNGAANIDKLSESLRALVSSFSSYETDLQWTLNALFLRLNEAELSSYRYGGSACNGDCIRHLLVKHLRRVGYNAASCKVKWQRSDTLLGGEYEYIDVMLPNDRIIIDTEFQCQFEIARPVLQYEAAVKLLPAVFVGRPAKLKRILHIMSEAAKYSLKNNCMHVPPWRTLEYMQAKWFSAQERSTIPSNNKLQVSAGCQRCSHQFRHVKSSMIVGH